MKLIARRRDGETVVGALRDGGVAWLGSAASFYRDPFAGLSQAASTEVEPLDRSEQLAPAVWPGARVICVGLNYRAHAAEGGFTPPEYPVIFGRWTRSLIADGETVPQLDDALDWEGELAVVIGRELADSDEEQSLQAVLGYAAFNDVTARTFQRHTHQWTPGKNMDCSGAMGTIVTADEVGDPAEGLKLETRLNGVVMQSATTKDMIFSVGAILAYLSRIMTLYPGDIIVSGTPEGVGYARKPPIRMQPGDLIEVEIERVGKVSNRIVDRGQRRG